MATSSTQQNWIETNESLSLVDRELLKMGAILIKNSTTQQIMYGVHGLMNNHPNNKGSVLQQYNAQLIRFNNVEKYFLPKSTILRFILEQQIAGFEDLQLLLMSIPYSQDPTPTNICQFQYRNPPDRWKGKAPITKLKRPDARKEYMAYSIVHAAQAKDENDVLEALRVLFRIKKFHYKDQEYDFSSLFEQLVFESKIVDKLFICIQQQIKARFYQKELNSDLLFYSGMSYTCYEKVREFFSSVFLKEPICIQYKSFQKKLQLSSKFLYSSRTIMNYKTDLNFINRYNLIPTVTTSTTNLSTSTLITNEQLPLETTPTISYIIKDFAKEIHSKMELFDARRNESTGMSALQVKPTFLPVAAVFQNKSFISSCINRACWIPILWNNSNLTEFQQCIQHSLATYGNIEEILRVHNINLLSQVHPHFIEQLYSGPIQELNHNTTSQYIQEHWQQIPIFPYQFYGFHFYFLCVVPVNKVGVTIEGDGASRTTSSVIVKNFTSLVAKLHLNTTSFHNHISNHIILLLTNQKEKNHNQVRDLICQLVPQMNSFFTTIFAWHDLPCCFDVFLSGDYPFIAMVLGHKGPTEQFFCFHCTIKQSNTDFLTTYPKRTARTVEQGMYKPMLFTFIPICNIVYDSLHAVTNLTAVFLEALKTIAIRLDNQHFSVLKKLQQLFITEGIPICVYKFDSNQPSNNFGQIIGRLWDQLYKDKEAIATILQLRKDQKDSWRDMHQIVCLMRKLNLNYTEQQFYISNVKNAYSEFVRLFCLNNKFYTHFQAIESPHHMKLHGSIGYFSCQSMEHLNHIIKQIIQNHSNENYVINQKNRKNYLQQVLEYFLYQGYLFTKYPTLHHCKNAPSDEIIPIEEDEEENDIADNHLQNMV